jgi:hypothetical protein
MAALSARTVVSRHPYRRLTRSRRIRPILVNLSHGDFQSPALPKITRDCLGVAAGAG